MTHERMAREVRRRMRNEPCPSCQRNCWREQDHNFNIHMFAEQRSCSGCGCQYRPNVMYLPWHDHKWDGVELP